MPAIVQDTQQTRYSINSPVPIASAEEKRGPGESIQKAGEAATKSAGQLADLYEQSQNAKRAVAENSYKMQLQELSDKNQFEAMRTSEADGSDLVDNYQTNYRIDVADVLDSITDSDLRARVSVHAQSSESQATGTLYGHALKLSVANTQDIQAKNTSAAALSIRQDPTKFNERWADYQKTTQDLVDHGVFSPLDGQRALREGGESFAVSALHGLMDKGDFDGARKALTDFAPYLIDSDAKGHRDATDVLDLIDKTQQGAIDSQIKNARQNQLQSDRNMREASVRNAAQLTVALDQAQTPEQRAAITKQAQSLLAGRQISQAAYNSLGVQTRRIGLEDEADIKGELIEAMSDGDEDHLQEITQRITETPGLSSQSRTRLLKLNSDYANNLTPLAKSRLKISDDTIKAGAFGMLPETVLQVKERRSELMKSGGMDAQTAAKKALQEVTSSPEQITVPGIAPTKQKSAASTEAEVGTIISNFKKIKSPTADQWQDYVKTLNTAKAKLNSFKIHGDGK